MIVGVNKYKLANEDPVDVLCVDNTKVRESQVSFSILLLLWIILTEIYWMSQKKRATSSKPYFGQT